VTLNTLCVAYLVLLVVFGSGRTEQKYQVHGNLDLHVKPVFSYLSQNLILSQSVDGRLYLHRDDFSVFDSNFFYFLGITSDSVSISVHTYIGHDTTHCGYVVTNDTLYHARYAVSCSVRRITQ